MKPVQYIVANKGLGMSGGKLAAQVAHASVNAILDDRYNGDPREDPLFRDWMNSGHTKIVLEARDTEHLLMVERYVNERGVRTVLVIDEGRTEIAPHTPTALATYIVDKTDPMVEMAFGDLRTYKDPKPVPPQQKGNTFLHWIQR
jgi:PTH2 family peptidyl-tRNA hydrolase